MKRRTFIKSLAAMSVVPTLPFYSLGDSKVPLLKAIPSTGERVPVIGMGTFRTFNVGTSEKLRSSRVAVLKEFFDAGGTVIDSSPMYGTSEEVVGHCLEKSGNKDKVFSATKVWTQSVAEGKEQFQKSLKYWRTNSLDLYQVHNVVNWKEHIKVLRAYKASGKIRYLGVTTSHAREIDEVKEIMKKEELDFVQFTYSMEERWNDPDALKIAKDQGIAVLINRPFERGYIFDKVKGKKLPGIGKELGCKYWSEYFLKWIVSHPAVTCAIPATSQVEHMKENMRALYGEVPDMKTREKMLKAFTEL